MNTQEYITSGILELYAMGQLSRKQAQAVEQMAHDYPEIKNEIEKIEIDLEKFANSFRITPSDEVKAQLLEKLDSSNIPTPSLPQTPRRQAPVVVKSYFSAYAVAASILVALISGAIAFYYKVQLNNAKDKIVALESDKSTLAQNVQSANNKLKNKTQVFEEYFNIINDSTVKSIDLKGLALSPQSQAKIYWNKLSKEVFIKVNSLPSPTTDQQYQLWALEDGKPIDAGVFEINDTLLVQKMKIIANAQAFAVTLEKKGGSTTPTLEEMYLLGNVSIN